MKKHFIAFILSVASLIAAHAQIPQVNAERHSGGIARQKNNRVFAPSANALALPQKSELSAADREIANEAARLVETQATTALLLIEDGKILFERYKAPADEHSPLFSQSMSKSLAAVIIGKLLCRGAIASLDDAASKYTNAIAGTAPGEASIRNLLRMSSGVTDAVMAGGHLPNEWIQITTGKLSTIDLIRQVGAQDIAAGKEFRYSATDTFALALVADGAGGFFEAFEREVWQAAGTGQPGYWLYDRLGNPAAASGFSATARDWGRLAMFVMRELEQGSPCMRQFLQAATSAQIANQAKRVGRAFDAYGYQMWIAQFGGRKSVWWVGYGGQRVGFDPETRKVLVLTSWREDYMADVYRLFAKWQALTN